MLHHLKESCLAGKGSVDSVVCTPICGGFVVFNILSCHRTLKITRYGDMLYVS